MRILLMGAPTTNGYKCFGSLREISGGGWVENLVEAVATNSDTELFVCFYADFVTELKAGTYQNVTYIALPMRTKALRYCSREMIYDLQKALDLCNPDVVHIIGTEREHDLRLFELAGAEKTVVSITGLVSVYARHYYGGIDQKFLFHRSLGDFLRRGGPVQEKKRFEKDGVYEKVLIGQAKYVTGRTTWDYACVKQINPKAAYTYCSEILNPVYFARRWDVKKVKRRKIFVSQASYPLKGFHMLLEAYPIIREQYPDCEIYVAGPNILKNDRLTDRVKRTTYAKYLLKKMQELQIPSDAVHYLGPLTAEEMSEQYLSANVFVLPSAIENSPNSLGEAMALGMPCVASCEGGVQDMIDDRKDGFIYPFDAPYMLAHYICRIFEDDELAAEIGSNAAVSAKKRFDPTAVQTTTLKLYQRIAEQTNRR